MRVVTSTSGGHTGSPVRDASDGPSEKLSEEPSTLFLHVFRGVHGSVALKSFTFSPIVLAQKLYHGGIGAMDDGRIAPVCVATFRDIPIYSTRLKLNTQRVAGDLKTLGHKNTDRPIIPFWQSGWLARHFSICRKWGATDEGFEADEVEEVQLLATRFCLDGDVIG